MITPDQEKWLAHLSDTDIVTIYPFDPLAHQKFEKIKSKIHTVLGETLPVLHRGATSLGISGQGELDIYIPVSVTNFDVMVSEIEKIFGKPGSLYSLERARFVTTVDNTKVEVFVINEAGEGWMSSSKFYDYLRSHPESLDAYRKLKEEGNGLSNREYYRRKIPFINNIRILSRIYSLPHFKNAIELVRKNSTGKVWLIGSTVYRSVLNELYSSDLPIKDFDFIVEHVDVPLTIPKDADVETSSFGNIKIICKDFSTDLVSLNNIHSIQMKGLESSIENYLLGTPLTMQSIALDLDTNEILGQVGIQAIQDRTVEIHDREEVEYTARLRETSLEEYLVEMQNKLGLA